MTSFIIIATRNYPCFQYEKKMRSTSKLTRYMNTYIRPINQLVLRRRIQPEQYILIAGENDNLSENFEFHKDEKPALGEPDIEEDDLDLTSKSSDTKSRTGNMLLECTLQAGLPRSEL